MSNWFKTHEELHADGLLESLDYESFDTCEPCLMGKMNKTPFSGTMERATNFLDDTSILHHAFILIFIALWAVIKHYVTILMPILSYFTRFT